jgi:hypothetical protein
MSSVIIAFFPESDYTLCLSKNLYANAPTCMRLIFVRFCAQICNRRK